MRAATTIARAATRATWPLTRLDRNGQLPGPIVLCYHRVLPRVKAQAPRYSVTPQQFREQMSLLAGEGFKSLTLDQFHQMVAGDRQVPARAVLVTFDDGFADIYSTAWPIAREFDIKLNVFLCTGLAAGLQIETLAPRTLSEKQSARELLNHWRPLSWGQVREMSKDGVGFGFHSHTHRNHGGMSREEIAADAKIGLGLIQAEIGMRPSSFAFPYGHYGSYSTAAISELKQQGLSVFFTTEMDRTALPTDGPISRLVIHPEDDLQSFRRKLYGGYEWVGKLRRFGYALRASLRHDVRATSQV